MSATLAERMARAQRAQLESLAATASAQPAPAAPEPLAHETEAARIDPRADPSAIGMPCKRLEFEQLAEFVLPAMGCDQAEREHVLARWGEPDCIDWVIQDWRCKVIEQQLVPPDHALWAELLQAAWSTYLARHPQASMPAMPVMRAGLGQAATPPDAARHLPVGAAPERAPDAASVPPGVQVTLARRRPRR